MGERTSRVGVFWRVSSQRVEGAEAFEAVWRRDGYRPCEPRSELPGAQCWALNQGSCHQVQLANRKLEIGANL